jgi:REP element-mobilizing transposase RayT
MANTYTQIYIQMVFAVQGRAYMIQSRTRDELYKYITGVVRNKGQKLLAIGGMPDPIHLFVGMKPDLSVSELMRDVKRASSLFINERKWFQGHFSWQEGFGAFSSSHEDIDRVVKYVLNQEEHPRRKTFREEYLALLKASEVDYDEKYLFDWMDED